MIRPVDKIILRRSLSKWEATAGDIMAEGSIGTFALTPEEALSNLLKLLGGKAA